jgi:membrane-associated phospholipid phosphatase
MRASRPYDDQRVVSGDVDRRCVNIDPRRRATWAQIWLTVFVLLTALVAVGALDHIDQVVRDAIDSHRSRALTTACRYLTDVVSPPVDAVLLATGSIWVARRQRQWWPVLVAAASGGTTFAVVLMVKATVGRSGLDLDDPAAHGRNWPSGHTAAVLVCLGIAVLLATAPQSRWRRRLLSAVALLTTVVAAALVYDDFHWLTDTIASATLGLAVLEATDGWLSRRAGPAARTYRRPRAPAMTPQ